MSKFCAVRKVFCNAYKKGLYGRRYQWLIVGMYSKNWWEKGGDDVECSVAPRRAEAVAR